MQHNPRLGKLLNCSNECAKMEDMILYVAKAKVRDEIEVYAVLTTMGGVRNPLCLSTSPCISSIDSLTQRQKSHSHVGLTGGQIDARSVGYQLVTQHQSVGRS